MAGRMGASPGCVRRQRGWACNPRSAPAGVQGASLRPTHKPLYGPVPFFSPFSSLQLKEYATMISRSVIVSWLICASGAAAAEGTTNVTIYKRIAIKERIGDLHFAEDRNTLLVRTQTSILFWDLGRETAEKNIHILDNETPVFEKFRRTLSVGFHGKELVTVTDGGIVSCASDLGISGNLESWKVRSFWPSDGWSSGSAAFSDDGKHLIFGCKRTIFSNNMDRPTLAAIWRISDDGRTSRVRHELKDISGIELSCVSISRDGRLAAFGGRIPGPPVSERGCEVGGLVLIDTDSGQKLIEIKDQLGPVVGMSFRPQNDILIFCPSNESVFKP